jgi:hypothetical protein
MRRSLITVVLICAPAVFAMGQASESVLYSFGSNSNDGAYPLGGLSFDTAGNIYGVVPPSRTGHDHTV